MRPEFFKVIWLHRMLKKKSYIHFEFSYKFGLALLISFLIYTRIYINRKTRGGDREQTELDLGTTAHQDNTCSTWLLFLSVIVRLFI